MGHWGLEGAVGGGQRGEAGTDEGGLGAHPGHPQDLLEEPLEEPLEELGYRVGPETGSIPGPP